MMNLRKIAVPAGILLVLCGFLLCACTAGDGESRTESATETDSADESAGWLDECAADARAIAGRLDRDAAAGTVLAMLGKDADPAAIMQSDAYTVQIARLVSEQTACGAESVCVYAFCGETALFVYDSRFGEKENPFTSYSLRKETWEECGFAADKGTLLSGKDLGYQSLAGEGRSRYTVLTHWFTEEDGTVFYVAVTKLR